MRRGREKTVTKKVSGQRAVRTGAVLLLAAAVLTGCGSTEAAVTEEEETSILVSTEEVKAGSMVLSNSFIGTISPEETVMVMPMVAGTVTDTFYEVGDRVNAGDVLFKIDDEAAKLQLAQAEMGVVTAQQGVASAEFGIESATGSALDGQNIGYESQKNSAQTNYEQAQIAYVNAKDAYEDAQDDVDDAKKEMENCESGAASEKKAWEEAKKALEEAEKAYEADKTNPTKKQAVEEAEKKETECKGKVEKAEAALQAAQGKVDAARSRRDAARTAYLSAQTGYKAADEGRKIVEETIELANGQALEDQIESLEMQKNSAELGVETASVGVQSAELALSYYTVTAPVSGVIESKNVDVNGMAAQGSPAYTIVNNDSMTVTFYVSEDVKNTLTVGQKIILERNSNTYEAAITEIGSSVNAQTGLFEIKGCVAADGAELPGGVSVKITADTYTAENVMIIPYDAVYYENEGAYVYCAVDGRAKKTPIVTGIFDENSIVVTEGLSLGDSLITSWSPQLTDGVLLDVAEEEPEDASEAGSDAAESEAGSGTEN